MELFPPKKKKIFLLSNDKRAPKKKANFITLSNNNNDSKKLNPIKNGNNLNSNYQSIEEHNYSRNSSKIKNDSSKVLTSINANLNYSKLVEDEKKKIEELNEKIAKQKKLLEERKKGINITKKRNNEIKENISQKEKELEKIKKENQNYQNLNKDLTTKINELTQYIEEEKQREANAMRRRQLMTNYLMSMMMGIRRRNVVEYPNVDNMSYEQLLDLEERMGNVSKGLSEEAIKKLKKEKYVKDKFSEDKCIICQYEYKVDEQLIILPCNHNFHLECIIEWLKKEKTCPFCKSEINI
jgi:DNA repair exonuclease SbcCD ATPase subunit